MWRSKSGGSGVTRPSIIGTRHLGHGLPLISSAVAYEASMVPLRLRQISAAARYCSVTAIRCATCRRKCPARKALGSRAGLRKLVVSVWVPCHGTRLQSSDVAASCLVKVAHRAASVRSPRRWPAIEISDNPEPFRAPRLGQACRYLRRPIQKWRGAAATISIAAKKRT